MSIELTTQEKPTDDDPRHTLNRVRTPVGDRGPLTWWYKVGIILIVLVLVFSTQPNLTHDEYDVGYQLPENFNQIEDNDGYPSITKYITDKTRRPPKGQSIFSLVDGDVVDNHDLLNDTANYTVISTPFRESSGWISDGAPSITFAEGVWYASHRQRTGALQRGNYLLLDQSTDLVNWANVWNVSKADVGPASIISFERSVIRHYEGIYYLYFSAEIAGLWKCYYVKASTVAGLETKLENSASWSAIISGAKDPNTIFHDGTYYFLNSDGLYKDDNPEGTSIEFIVDFTQLYKDAYGGGAGNPGNNTGTMIFDDASSTFIYWRGGKVSWNDATIDDLVWFFATSPDLEHWTARDRHLVYSDYPEISGSIRYMDYFANDTTEAVVMEWEDGLGMGFRSVVIWDYPRPTAKVAFEGPSGGGIGVIDLPLDISFSIEPTVPGIKFVPEVPRSGRVLQMEWDFGDGSTSKNLEPTHYYRIPGEYNVTLSVTVEGMSPVELSRDVTVPRPTSLQQLLHSVELTNGGVNLWVSMYSCIFVPSATLLILGGLVIGNVYLWGSDRRSAGRGITMSTGAGLIVAAFPRGPVRG